MNLAPRSKIIENNHGVFLLTISPKDWSVDLKRRDENGEWTTSKFSKFEHGTTSSPMGDSRWSMCTIYVSNDIVNSFKDEIWFSLKPKSESYL